MPTASESIATAFFWTAENTEKLRRLISDGLTVSQVARSLSEEINQPVNKNMVIGRCWRTGIILNPDPRKFLTSAQLQEIRKASLTESGAALARRIGASPSSVYSVRNFKAYKEKHQKKSGEPTPNPFPDVPGCLWPYGDPGPSLRFCGAGRAPGKPYCAEHAARAYDRRPVAAIEVA